MTDERQDEVLDFGFQVMKYMGAGRMALWLAEDGWDGGTIFTAERIDPQHVQVRLRQFDVMSLYRPFDLN